MVSPSTPGLPLFPRTRFHAVSRLLRSQTSSMSWSSAAGRSAVRFAASGSVPGLGGRGFTSPGRRQGQTQLRVLDCLPQSTHESRVLLATPNRSGLRRVAAAVRSLAVSALSGQCLDRAGRRVPSTVPSADFCVPFRSSHDSLSPVHGTERRSPGVSLTAVTAALPDLQPWPLMDVDFAISRPLVRPRMPRIRFLFVRSQLCFTLPPDPASRRRPCASLALRLHQAVQRTCTSKLSNMPGTRLNRYAVDAESTCLL